MENSVDVNELVKATNQELLLQKKKIDLDNSMESLSVFYSNYSTTMAEKMNDIICKYHNIDPNSDDGKIYLNTITGFFNLANKKLNEIIKENANVLKDKLATLDDDSYNKELDYMSLVITNNMLDYYGESAKMLINEVIDNLDDVTCDRVSNYILEVLTVKMINKLKENMMFSMKVITNNSEENNQKIESINEKTIKN